VSVEAEMEMADIGKWVMAVSGDGDGSYMMAVSGDGSCRW
jgi:hypothetical protein